MYGPVVRVYGYSSVLTVLMVSLTAKVDHVCPGGGEWDALRRGDAVTAG